jgi:hypothetical protein
MQLLSKQQFFPAVGIHPYSDQPKPNLLTPAFPSCITDGQNEPNVVTFEA